MKYFILPFLFLLNHNVFTQIKFVDAHDHVLIPPESGFKTFNIDINEDTQDDVVLFIKTNDTGESLGCQNAGGSDWHVAYFASTLNAFGLNKVNSKTNSSDLGIDCTNDTLSVNDTWKETAKIYKGFPLHYSLCENVGYGPNKQGVRLTKVNPSTGALGFIYGYIDYTITNEGEIILHGWYYQTMYNVPIIANTKLDYPYDGDCIFRDTITVIDTNFIDVPRYVSVTDTLIINLNVPNGSNELIKNEILIYPNPTNSHIYVEMGNYTLLKNYEIQILNSIGQPVYYSPIELQQYYIDLNQWGGKGIYYVRIKNSAGITIETKKIILQ